MTRSTAPRTMTGAEIDEPPVPRTAKPAARRVQVRLVRRLPAAAARRRRTGCSTLADRVEIDHFLEARSRSSPGPTTSASSRARSPRPRTWRGSGRSAASAGSSSRSAPARPPAASRPCGTGAGSTSSSAAVYASPAYVAALATSTPIADHVPVDFELRGCPIDAGQLVELITARRRRPQAAACRGTAVCVECKARGTVCVAVAQGIPCLGPVTQAGCGAICPAHDRECFGCYGPSEQPNLVSLTGFYEHRGTPRRAARAARAVVQRLGTRRFARRATGWRPAEGPP